MEIVDQLEILCFARDAVEDSRSRGGDQLLACRTAGEHVLVGLGCATGGASAVGMEAAMVLSRVGGEAISKGEMGESLLISRQALDHLAESGAVC